MQKQFDQSGRLEDAHATTWACADDGSLSLVMPSAVKRKAFAVLRRQGITGAQALVRIYTAAMFLLLKDIITTRGIVIVLDREYPGYDADIKAMLLRKFWRAGLDVSHDAITFGNVGKNAEAHRVAWQIFVGRSEADRKITWAGLRRLL